MKRITLLILIYTVDFGAYQKREPASRRDDFGNFVNGFAKSPRVLRSSWILNERNLYCKIVKCCILSKVCMIKTAPHCTVSPQMWCRKKYKRLVYTSPDLLARFCKVNLSNAKNSAWFGFQYIICFPGLIYCDQEPLWLCCFLGVHIRRSTRRKIKFTLSLDCLQIIFL